MINENGDTALLFETCVRFVENIGIAVHFEPIEEKSFLPGFLICDGRIIIDRNKIEQYGDLMHEAGHLAVVPAAERHTMNEGEIIQRKNRAEEELMAIAWSYAACNYLLIDPSFVFHENGYNNGSVYIADSCTDNTYLGLHLLESIGITAAPHAHEPDSPSCCNIVRWLRA